MAKKKESSIFTPGAKALFPVVEGNTAATQANFKVSKSDLIGILTTGVLESLEEELKTAQKEHEKRTKAITTQLNAMQKKEYKAAVKLNAFNSTVPEKMRVEVSKDSRWVGNDYKECIRVDVSLTTEHTTISVPGSLESVSLRSVEQEYRYYIARSKPLNEAFRKLSDCRATMNEITERMEKARNNKYMTAQLNMNLLGSVSNGAAMAEGLGKLVENLKTSVFAKNDLPLLGTDE